MSKRVSTSRESSEKRVTPTPADKIRGGPPTTGSGVGGSRKGTKRVRWLLFPRGENFGEAIAFQPRDDIGIERPCIESYGSF